MNLAVVSGRQDRKKKAEAASQFHHWGASPPRRQHWLEFTLKEVFLKADCTCSTANVYSNWYQTKQACCIQLLHHCFALWVKLQFFIWRQWYAWLLLFTLFIKRHCAKVLRETRIVTQRRGILQVLCHVQVQWRNRNAGDAVNYKACSSRDKLCNFPTQWHIWLIAQYCEGLPSHFSTFNIK